MSLLWRYLIALPIALAVIWILFQPGPARDKDGPQTDEEWQQWKGRADD